MGAELPRTVDDLKTVTENVRSAAEGVHFENTSPTEPLVILRHYGPETNPDAPAIGDASK
jgi:hypothetical protein